MWPLKRSRSGWMALDEERRLAKKAREAARRKAEREMWKMARAKSGQPHRRGRS